VFAAWLTAAFILPMNSVFDNGFGRTGEALGATPHADASRYGDATDHVSFVGPLAKGDFSIFLD